MKTPHVKKILLIALALANGFCAGAQSNDAPDYASYSQVITERNIFDPNRVAHTRTTRHIPRRTSRAAVNSTPTFSLVGTMSYEKGRFAFFSGNDADLKKILVVDGSIAGYTVTDITSTQVTLTGADKKNLTLKIGDALRQEGGNWQLAADGEMPADAGAAAATAENAPAAPAGGGSAASEILKRLMQKREQESK